MSQSGPKGRVANSLVVMSSAAVLAVYAAGYSRTRAAANKLELQAEVRRPAPPVAAQPPRPEPEAPRPPAPPPLPVAKPASAPVPPPWVTSSEPAPETPAAPAPAPEPPAPAPTPVAPPAPPPAPAAPVWKDGTYTGWGTSRHGDIQASVVIANGRIEAATIAQCLTRYSCNVIENLPPEVAKRQSPEVDFVSGATQSANAFYYAVVDALAKAK